MRIASLIRQNSESDLNATCTRISRTRKIRMFFCKNNKHFPNFQSFQSHTTVKDQVANATVLEGPSCQRDSRT